MDSSFFLYFGATPAAAAATVEDGMLEIPLFEDPFSRESKLNGCDTTGNGNGDAPMTSTTDERKWSLFKKKKVVKGAVVHMNIVDFFCCCFVFYLEDEQFDVIEQVYTSYSPLSILIS